MSNAALELKKAQTEAYFRLHSDSIDIEILTGKSGTVVGDSIPGFFNHPIITEDARQIGAVEPLKRIPHVTFYSGYESRFRSDSDLYVMVDGVQWQAGQVMVDRTPGSYEGVLWLLKVR